MMICLFFIECSSDRVFLTVYGQLLLGHIPRGKPVKKAQQRIHVCTCIRCMEKGNRPFQKSDKRYALYNLCNLLKKSGPCRLEKLTMTCNNSCHFCILSCKNNCQLLEYSKIDKAINLGVQL